MTFIHKDWHRMLPFALHGIVLQYTLQQGQPPLSLGIQYKGSASHRGQRPVNGCSDEGQVKLNLKALLWNVINSYIKRMKQTFNKKARPREFQESSLVLKVISSVLTRFQGQ